ncbi:3'-5' exonuclease, partial [Paenibacillus zanthoxyli]|uniref:3'-5' exonuclease n=1 Tax=Paenibacillus zanthoxyli TaxID=369399 RepID=UPI000471FA3A
AGEPANAGIAVSGETVYAAPAISGRLRDKLNRFLVQLKRWRDEARQGDVSGLIWRIYGESGYLDWVGGLPGGAQRQSNLKALYDRAVQFENDTSARGLFRFLVFISRLRENGGDLGAAGGSGEQGEGVRIMTIHKSKGLEFPVVFLAGMSKGFNRQDLYAPFLMHKELGFGPRFLERETRVSYPTLPYLAIGRRSRLELLAEEMRVLYVGVTRPRDKMILVGTVRDLEGKAASWMSSSGGDKTLLPDHLLARGRSYLDWIGPALIRHPGAAILRKIAGKEGAAPVTLRGDLSNWSVSVLPSSELETGLHSVKDDGEDGEETRRKALHELSRGVPVTVYSGTDDSASECLSWHYPYAAAALIPAKTSVTELKSLLSLQDRPSYDLLEEGLPLAKERSAAAADSLHLRRPKFMEQRGITPAERGTVYHTLMQHIPLDGEAGLAEVKETLERLQQLRILTEEQAAAVEPEKAAAFYEHPLGRRLLASPWKRREMPFSYLVPASEAYHGLEALGRASAELPGESGGASSSVLIQGVIDCLFREEGRLILLDYKSDAVLEHRGGLKALEEKYHYQLGLYSQALGDILGEEVAEAWLYFFDGGHAVRV